MDAALWLPESKCVLIIQLESLKLLNWKHKTLTPAKEGIILLYDSKVETHAACRVLLTPDGDNAVCTALFLHMMKHLESSP